MLDFKDYFDEKKCYVASLIKMARADQSLSPVESMWLNFVTVSMGISPDELKEISENVERFNFKAPSDEKERFFMFFRLIQLMKVDLNIDRNEMKLCKEMGRKLFIQEEKVEQVLSFVENNEKKLISFEEVCTLLQ